MTNSEGSGARQGRTRIARVIRYVVTLPDGRRVERDSTRTLTHAVVVTRQEGVPWGVLALCATRELADRRADLHRKGWPSEPCAIVELAATVPLTDRQYGLLLAIGDGPAEIFCASSYAPLARRGLVRRAAIGMRWWRIQITRAGRDARDAFAAARQVRP